MRVLWIKAPLVLRRHPAVLAAVVATSLLVGLAAASAPFVRAGVESESLRGQLRTMTPLAAGLELTVDGPPAGDRRRRAALLALGRGLPSSGAPVPASEAETLVPDAFGGVRVNLLARTGAVANVRHLAASGGPGVWISDGTAKAVRRRPGESLPLAVFSSNGGIGRVTRVPIAGVYAALDGDLSNPYWQNYTQEIRPLDPNDPLPPPFVLTSYPRFLALVAEGRYFVTDHVEFPVDPHRLTLTGAEALERRYAEIQRRFARPSTLFDCRMPGGCHASSSLSSALAVARGDVAAVAPTVSLLSGFGIAVALAVAAAAGAFGVRRRSGEAELLHARGEAVGAFAARGALEGLLPVLAGCAAGVGIALLALRSFAPAGTIGSGTVLAGVGHAAAAGAAALAAYAAGAAAAFPRRTDRPHPWLRLVRRLPWELLPLAAAAALLGLLLAGGGLATDANGSTHPRLEIFVLPVLAVAGIAGLAVRASRRLLARRGGGAPPVAFLALRRLGAARGLLVAVVVAAAAAFGAFAYATTLSASLGRGAAEKAFVANGSDVQGFIDPHERITSPLPFPAVIVQVDSRDVFTPDGAPIDLLAGDPTALARTIVWGAGWGDDPRTQLPKLDRPFRGILPALATAGAPDVTAVIDQGKRIPVRIVGRIDGFPGTSAGRPALVVSSAALHAAAAAAGAVDPGPGATGLLWAKGDPAAIRKALAASNLAPAYLTNADYLRRSPSVVAATRTYGFFRTIGAAAAVLSLLALLLYLEARQRGQLIASALARRMGLAATADAAALALEAAAVVLAAGVVATAVAVALARPLVHHVDPLPQYAPASTLVVPWTTLAAALAAATVVAALLGAAAAALAARSNVAEALRVA